MTNDDIHRIVSVLRRETLISAKSTWSLSKSFYALADIFNEILDNERAPVLESNEQGKTVSSELRTGSDQDPFGADLWEGYDGDVSGTHAGP